jgi:TolB-like protein/DNA-binding winged helix-turn-helix (wHTH) protein/Flp pilus assembly protein TadD
VAETSAIARPLIRFGVFEIDTVSGELRKQGVKVRLQEQPFQVLLALVERPREVVSREELKNRLWPGNTYVDFDQGLNRAVAKLRDALDDPADRPLYIQTVARRGYRFLVPVERIGPANASRPSVPTSRRRYRWLPLTAGACAIAVLILVFTWQPWKPRPDASAPIRSIAVLPLENLSGDPNQEYFAEGMTDALITELARMNGISVISRTSVMSYKGAHVALPLIGRRLNVDAVMEGTVMRSGDKIRITVQLIRASTDRHLWARSYEEPLQNLVALQDSIARDVAEQVHARLAPAHALPSSPAYDAYMKGRSYLIASSNTPQAIRRAQNYFAEAVRQDPDFARAYAGSAECYVLLSEFRWLPPNQAYRPARQYIRKALALDNTLSEAHTALGWLTWRHDWDWRAAEKEFRYALQLNPNDIDAHQALAWYLAWRGRSDEARAEINKIHQLDPAQVWALDEAGIYYHQRDFPALLEAAQTAVVSRPDFWISHYFLAVAYEGSGRLQQAIPEYQKAVELSQGDTDPTAGLAHVYALTGRRAEAQKILLQWQRMSVTGYVSPYMIATIYSGLNQKDKAFEYLEKAYQERSTDLIYFAKADLRLDQLRADGRMRQLLQRVGFPQ